MQITFSENCDIYHKKDIKPLWDALKPEGMLTWNPMVPKYRWGLGLDDQENAPVSRDLEGDEFSRSSFDFVYHWIEDSDEDPDRGSQDGSLDDDDEDEGSAGGGSGDDGVEH